jgi:hypothetical protein
MQEKPPEEFDGVERHRALPIPALVVLPPESDLAMFARQQPPIGDGHTMGVAGQIPEHLLRPG